MDISAQFKRLDMLSPKFQVRYKSKESTKTCIGALLSCITFILSLVAIGFFSKNLFLKENPQTRLNTYFVPDSSIYLEDYPIAFAFVANKKLMSEEIMEDLEMQAELKEISITKDVIPTKVLKVEPCTAEMFGKVPEFEQYAPIGLHLCINPFKVYDKAGTLLTGEKPVMTKDLGEKGSKYIIFSVSRRDHLTNELFESKYGSVKMVTILSRRFLDLENYDEPVEMNSAINKIFLDNKIVREANVSLLKNRLVTDSGLVFEANNTVDFLTFGSISSNFGLAGSNRELTRINFASSTFGESSNREYLKLQTVLAQLSGVLKGITVAARLILVFVSKAQFYRENINDIFEYSREIRSEVNIKDHSVGNLNTVNSSSAKHLKNKSKNVSLLAFSCFPSRIFNKHYILKEKVNKLLDLHSIQGVLKEIMAMKQERANNTQRIVFNKRDS